MDAKVEMRLQWVQLYRKTGNASVTCRRCGISRPTLRKWNQRVPRATGLSRLARAIVGSDHVGFKLQQWQDYYNYQRRHSSLSQAPWQKWQQLAATIPTAEQLRAAYDPAKERTRHADYRLDVGKPRKVWCL